MGKVNLGKVRGTQIYTGNGITGNSGIPAVFEQSGIEEAYIGDLYINTDPLSNDKGNMYECVASGNAETATWCYAGNIRGPEANIINNLESTSITDGLSAYQGKKLRDMMVNAGTFTKHCVVECESKAYVIKLVIDNKDTHFTLTIDGSDYFYLYVASGSAEQTIVNISINASIGMKQSGGMLTDIRSSNANIYSYQILGVDSMVICSKNVNIWNALNEVIQNHEISGSIVDGAETIPTGVIYKVIDGIKKMFYPITHAKAVWYDKAQNVTVYDQVRENADNLKVKAPNNHTSSQTTYGKGTSAYYGHVKLSDSVESTSNASTGGVAATPKAVKAAYDLAKDAIPEKGGNVSGALVFTEEATEEGMLYITNLEELLELLRAIPGEDPTLIINDGMYTAGIGTLNIAAGKKLQLLIKNERLILEEGTDETYSAHFRPRNDNKCTIGTADKRFYGMWAGNSTIQTSDAREKENIIPLGTNPIMMLSLEETQTDIHSEIFDRLRPVQYNFINGNGRICYGLVAQEVAAALEELGIGENELDLVHHEFYKNTETGEEKESYGLAYNNLIALLIHEVQKLKMEIADLKK